MVAAITAISILAALAIFLSYRYNPRSTEDSIHPLWNLILIDLCGSRLGRLIPTPQYRLWTSPRDEAPDADTTLPDSNAKDVIPDYLILLYVLKKKTEKTIRSFLKSVTRNNLPRSSVDIAYLKIPLLVELKRPMTRGFEDLGSYVVDLHRAFENAKDQVGLQGCALFSSPRFREQDAVITIAGVGDWWTYSVMDRESCRIFESIEYDAIVTWGEENLGDIEDEADHILEPQTLKDNWSEDDVARRAQERKDDICRRSLEQKQGREARARAREERSEARDQAATEFADLVNNTTAGVEFSADLLNKASKLYGIWENIEELRDRPFVDETGDHLQTLDTPGEWHPIMHLGSKASNKALTLIKKHLQELAKKAAAEEITLNS